MLNKKNFADQIYTLFKDKKSVSLAFNALADAYGHQLNINDLRKLPFIQFDPNNMVYLVIELDDCCNNCGYRYCKLLHSFKKHDKFYPLNYQPLNNNVKIKATKYKLPNIRLIQRIKEILNESSLIPKQMSLTRMQKRHNMKYPQFKSHQPTSYGISIRYKSTFHIKYHSHYHDHIITGLIISFKQNQLIADNNNNNLNQLNDYNIQQQYGEADVIEDDLQSICSVKTTVYENNKYNQYHHRYNNYGKTNNGSGYAGYNNNNNTKYGKYGWRKYPDSSDLIQKMAQIEKYGVRHVILANSKCKRYGLKILEKDYKGNYIALYEGNINDFIKWIHAYLGLNFKHHLNVFSRSDLFGNSMVCGIDLSADQNQKYSMRIMCELCKYGWIDGLKYVIETLKINPIIKNNNFALLFEAACNFHDDTLKYLLIQNKYYRPFNILTKRHIINKKHGNQTIWNNAKQHLAYIIQPGLGWLHYLESIHYAPMVIEAMNINNNEQKQQFDDEGFQLQTNKMLKELNNINLIRDSVILPPFLIKKRLESINKLINSTEKVIFKIESCYYGLCADSADGKSLDKLWFWKPHGVEREFDQHIFEYIPYNNTGYGLIRMHKLSLNHYLTVIDKDNLKKVELCEIIASNNIINDIHDQLWKIEQLDILNGIWIRILSKSGYKLIISWKQDKQCGHMPLLTVSDNILNDNLCRDVFSVTNHNRDTLYYQYYIKYKYITKKSIVNNTIGAMLCKYRFWNQPVADGDGDSKFDIFKKKLRNIAEIIQQYHQRYIQINNDAQYKSKPTRRRPSPPPFPPSFNADQKQQID